MQSLLNNYISFICYFLDHINEDNDITCIPNKNKSGLREGELFEKKKNYNREKVVTTSP